MKKYICILLAMVCLLSLAGCACEHQWLHATGGHGQYCDKCGEFENLEEPCHFPSWEMPDCENPRRCMSCGELEAEAKPHTWSEEEPAICTECGKKKVN